MGGEVATSTAGISRNLKILSKAKISRPFSWRSTMRTKIPTAMGRHSTNQVKTCPTKLMALVRSLFLMAFWFRMLLTCVWSCQGVLDGILNRSKDGKSWLLLEFEPINSDRRTIQPFFNIARFAVHQSSKMSWLTKNNRIVKLPNR